MSAPPLAALVTRIRTEQRLHSEVPGFDPHNGNERAKYLFVLEAPGPQALKSGVISLDNPDRTAANFRAQLQEAGVARTDIAIWNVVPWYLGNLDRTHIRGALVRDVELGLGYLDAVIQTISGLRCVVLVGGAARREHIRLSHTTRARILSCHHPSPKVQNTAHGAWQENVAVFRFMQTISL
jgi:uracil-DNA glycosylase